ncbi:rho guanine nucleotide exchange factor 19 isoform X2 [Microcaecilia unicolor]|uniref:Rho guanine nucleotide exchange factor 19-like isoform X2 n=1 Tax=Microcaecilia unicolor TaxID=1415580 RepID=A0A6P7WFS9_9AMPH|nr:rho guanine nucleotide exchange factor 19-like isoform X2 [Microcaecilia unicolor]XP_030042066.1 rho guanine nucleotide exchange factor 19-like isoform X2 [Microcaecilia unicolor]XP_030042067.1 rho guanine nucleotide exchange factor 19-like isoform X2 [Microcaecilia unicolor]
MDLFCRKPGCLDSPPQPTVLVKRCASCPDTQKTSITQERLPEQRRLLLPAFFRAKKPRKALSSIKWASYDDVHLCCLSSPSTHQYPDSGSMGEPSNSDVAALVDSSCFTNTAAGREGPEVTSPAALLCATFPRGAVKAQPSATEPTSVKSACPEASFLGNLSKRGTKEAKKCKRRESKYIHSQPLYQEYWVTYTTADGKPKEQRFGVETPLSIAGFISSSLLGASSQMSPRDYTSFWQDIPEVKTKGLLEKISPQRHQLQETVFEVITSEASYLRSLSVAVNHFQKSSKLLQLLGPRDMHTLFSNLQQVKEVSERFLLDLEDQLESDVFLSEIGELILRHCPAFQKVYIPYVTNQMYQEQLIQQLMRENAKFPQVLRQLEEQPICQRQPLKSFLVLPFQRITRLKILLQAILKLALALSDSGLSQAVDNALQTIAQIVSECNENVRCMKQTEELVLLEKQMEFLEIKSIPLISRGRWLVRQGELVHTLVLDGGVGHKPRLSSKPCHLHLFSDLLLLSRKREDGRFSVQDYAQICHVKVEPITVPVLPDTSFLLCLIQNHKGICSKYLLTTGLRNSSGFC